MVHGTAEMCLTAIIYRRSRGRYILLNILYKKFFFVKGELDRMGGRGELRNEHNKVYYNMKEDEK